MTFHDFYAEIESLNEAEDVSKGVAREIELTSCRYRLGFSSMGVMGLPDSIKIGTVSLLRGHGPVRTQETAIQQRIGLPISYDKVQRRMLEVATGRVLTVAEIEDQSPFDIHERMIEHRESALAAIGIVESILDERIAIDEVFEDLVFFNGDTPVAGGDSRTRLRAFLPFEVLDEEREAITALAAHDVSAQPASFAAVWFQHALAAGPSANAVVYFWLAIESFTVWGAEGKTQVQQIEKKLTDAGFDLDVMDISVGRLYGLRGELSHSGSRDHSMIRDAFYRLEAICRVLIRAELGISSSWPPILMSGVFGENAEELEIQQANPIVEFHDSFPNQPTGAEVSVPSAGMFPWDRVYGEA